MWLKLAAASCSVGIQDIDLGKSRCRDTCSVAQVHLFRTVSLGYH